MGIWPLCLLRKQQGAQKSDLYKNRFGCVIPVEVVPDTVCRCAGIRDTDAARHAVTKSNINYYLSQGWTKEELIKKAFFTEKDFEDAGL